MTQVYYPTINIAASALALHKHFKYEGGLLFRWRGFCIGCSFRSVHFMRSKRLNVHSIPQTIDDDAVHYAIIDIRSRSNPNALH